MHTWTLLYCCIHTRTQSFSATKSWYEDNQWICFFFSPSVTVKCLSGCFSLFFYFVYVSTLKAGVLVYVIAFRHAHHSDHPWEQANIQENALACTHPLNYMITSKQNHRSSERGKSFTSSVVHVIAALILTSLWEVSLFFSVCNLAVKS